MSSADSDFSKNISDDDDNGKNEISALPSILFREKDKRVHDSSGKNQILSTEDTVTGVKYKREYKDFKFTNIKNASEDHNSAKCDAENKLDFNPSVKSIDECSEINCDKEGQMTGPHAVNVAEKGFFYCWVCLHRFTQCLAVKEHILLSHCKALCALSQMEELPGEAQVLLFCPKDCTFTSSELPAFSLHLSACQNPKLQTEGQDFVDIQNEFISDEYEKLKGELASGVMLSERNNPPTNFEWKRKKGKVQYPSHVSAPEQEDKDDFDESSFGLCPLEIGSLENSYESLIAPKHLQRQLKRGYDQAMGQAENTEEETHLNDIHVCPLCQLVFPTSLLLKCHKNQCYTKKYWKAVREQNIQGLFTPHHLQTSSNTNSSATDNKKCLDCDGDKSRFDNNAQEGSRKITPDNMSIKCKWPVLSTEVQKQIEEKLLKFSESTEGSGGGHGRDANTLSSAGKTFECSECGHSFRRKSNIVAHMRIHTGERPFQCGECGMRFNQAGNVHMHMKTHMKDKPFKCLECGKGFNRSKNLVIHMRSHLDEKPFECDKCGMKFRQDIDLRYHKSKSHVDDWEKSFESDGTVLMHMSAPTAEKPFQCDVCGKCYTWNGHLQRHKRIHEGEKPAECMQNSEKLKVETEESDKNLKYDCDIYHRFMETYLREKTSESHDRDENCDLLERHSGIPTRQDCVAYDRFRKNCIQAGDLATLVKPLARRKPYSCSECDKTFCHSGGLNVHMRSHTGQRPFECDECGRGFSRKGDLQMHVRIHTGEKPFKCDECGKTFHHSGNYHKHLRTHTGEKPYECEQCRKSFNQSGALQIHMRIHTGEKPYKCDECSESFSRSSHLHRHKRTHTGERPYSCEECGKAFSQRSNLYKHLRTHTWEKNPVN